MRAHVEGWNANDPGKTKKMDGRTFYPASPIERFNRWTKHQLLVTRSELQCSCKFLRYLWYLPLNGDTYTGK